MCGKESMRANLGEPVLPVSLCTVETVVSIDKNKINRLFKPGRDIVAITVDQLNVAAPVPGKVILGDCASISNAESSFQKRVDGIDSPAGMLGEQSRC